MSTVLHRSVLAAAAVSAAMVVAVSPIQPVETSAVLAPRTVSAEVRLAVDPITALLQVATDTADNIKTLTVSFAANPTPVITKIVQNQIAYATYLATNPTPAALLAVAASQATNLVNALGAVFSLDVLSRVVAIPTAPLLSLAGGVVATFQDPVNVLAILSGAFLNGIKVPTGPSSTVQLYGVFTPGGPTVLDPGGSIQDILDIRVIIANAIKPFTPPVMLVASATARDTAAEDDTATATPAPKRTTGTSGRSVVTRSTAAAAASAATDTSSPSSERATSAKKTAHSSGSSGRSARTAD